MASCEKNYKEMFGTEDNLNFLNISDGTLHTEDGCRFDIHKIILAQRSRYFRALFCANNRSRRRFEISGVSGNILSKILRFIYIGEIRVTSSNITSLLRAANYLSLDELLKNILSKVNDKITVENCISLLQESRKNKIESLHRTCSRFIEMHFEEILNKCPTEDYDIPLPVFAELLVQPGLNVSSERVVWLSIIKWVQQTVLSRLKYVPEMLRLLAVEELDENLAQEITEHTLVSENPFCKNIYEEMKNGDSLTALQQFVQNRLSHLELHRHRIPPKLFIAAKFCTGSDDKIEIRITYDQNVDFWRKIGETNFDPDYLIAIRNDVFMFDFYMNRCLIFDIKEKKETLRQIFSKDYTENYARFRALSIEDTIYILRPVHHRASRQTVYRIQNFNPVTNSRVTGVLLCICFGDAEVIDKSIYVIGCARNLETMIVRIYNTESKIISTFPPPKIFRVYFVLVSLQEKLWLIGGWDKGIVLRSVEVFDTRNQTWSDCPDLPYDFSSPCAVSLNDDIIVYNRVDDKGETMPVRWNDAEECWEDVKENMAMGDIYLHALCELKNRDTIRDFWEENRRITDKFQKWTLM